MPSQYWQCVALLDLMNKGLRQDFKQQYGDAYMHPVALLDLMNKGLRLFWSGQIDVIGTPMGCTTRPDE